MEPYFMIMKMMKPYLENHLNRPEVKEAISNGEG